ncbi:MAG: DUF4886 domain-containing protein [Clostridia bacterium]|nr:DUF4886 domain-containing protein [Clostridia bacterium]
MKVKNLLRMLALTLSVLMVVAAFPISAMAETEKFVPENLLQTHLESAHETVYYGWNNGEAYNESAGTFDDVARFDSRGALAGSTDGDLTTPHDVYSYNETSTNLIGARYHLDAAYYVGSIVLYSGYADNNDVFRVYASDTLKNLYSANNIVSDEVVCDGSGTTVKVDRTVQYIGIVFDSIKTLALGNGDKDARVREFQVWSADESAVFRSENVFRTKLKNVTGMNMFVSSGNVEESTRFDGNGAIAASTDGDCSTQADIYGALDWDPSRYVGAVYELNDTVYADHVTIYSGFDDMKDTWRVYASNSLDDLYSASNIVGEVACGNAGVDVEIKDYVKYVAFFCTDFELYNIRLKEFELWTGDDSAIFRPENAFQTKLDSAEGMLMFVSNGNVEASSRFDGNGALAGSIDGDTATTTDVYGALDGNPSRYVGAVYTLTESVYADRITLYSGNESLQETWRVYASTSMDDLYSGVNMIDEVTCNGKGVDVELKKEVQYVALVCTAYDGVMRVKEFELWTGDDSAIFRPENALQTKLQSAGGLLMFVSNGNVQESTRFNGNGALDGSIDGDLATTHDVYGALDWDPARYVGAVYTLTESVYADRVTVYSGFDDLQETWRVYASNSLSDLYTGANMIGEVVCGNDPVNVSVGKEVKYLALFCTNYDGVMRVKEFQLWTGDPNGEADDSENLFQTALGDTQSIAMSVIDSAVSENGRFDYNGVIAASVDGNLEETKEVWGALDWEYPIYPGALYSLNENTFADRLVIYAEGAFKVYAGDAMDTLYTNYNVVSEFDETTKAGTVIEIGKYVKYVAIFSQDGANVAEFQLWSGKAPEEAPEKDPNVLSVLTIGNSFSENTSIYASDIANANGKALTFGYLKYPSCTLAQHLEAATNDMAVFKFQVVSPNGERKTYGTEAPSWKSNAGSYTVAQALDFMDWDVVVFQQGSYDARSASSFDALPGLVDYVSKHAPNAKLMFHEVWGWGSWNHEIFETIKTNTENAARECGLEIIPTGIAFEYVREAVNDYHYPNENDGYYQHANSYGQYIAGVCYVNALFGIECDASAFANHPYINADGRVAVLTACANHASKYYKSYGDVDFDGNINADDCVMLKAHLLGNTVSDLDTTLADANNDGVIDVRDLVRIKKTVAAE